MTKIEELKQQLIEAQKVVQNLELQIEDENSSLANHQYLSHGAAEYVLEDLLRQQAFEDCEGAGNCGAEQYEQAYQITGEPDVYLAVIDVEYNRHDKTYYYIEECEYSWSKL